MTWFIDPPYQKGGAAYVHSNRKIDFKALAAWCKSREGQTIVCENMYADWMEFKPFVSQHVRTGRHSEAIWTNEPSEFDNVQTKLFSDL